jgi:hypothetical protein
MASKKREFFKGFKFGSKYQIRTSQDLNNVEKEAALEIVQDIGEDLAWDLKDVLEEGKKEEYNGQ